MSVVSRATRLLCIISVVAFSLSAQGPTMSVSPTSGSGATQTFTMVSSSSAGWQNIQWQQVLFNYGIDAGGACYILVYPASSTVYISSDTGYTYGSGWSSSGTAGSAGTIQNSQCQINLAASSVSGSGSNLTTTLALTFLPGLPGPQNIYTITADNSGNESGWQQMGTWTTSSVIQQPPQLISATPPSGTGLEQVFSYTASSVNGGSYLTAFWALIGPSLYGGEACFVVYDRGGNELTLINDAGTAGLGDSPVGSPGTIGNSQCTLDVGASSVIQSGNDLTLNLAISFNSGWAGARSNYLMVEDREDYTAGWTQMGTWTVGAAPTTDPRRTGVLTTGSYWGGGGEQIDTLSGNLNFSVPLVKPQGASGWTLPVNLAYNSQNWEQQNGTTIQTGHDVGYGFGWQAQIGSLTPVWAVTQTSTTLTNYIFTDVSGAQYNLNVSSNNVWSSQSAAYIWFDANHNVLHFPDGSWWQMGCTSSSGEPDAGTMYPTRIEDSTNFFITISYLAGAGVPSASSNTSARIAAIYDNRSGPSTAAYTFTYNSDSPVAHLTGITNSLQTAETYSLTYASASLGPPFGSNSNYAGATTTHLASVTVPTTTPYQFTYDTAGAGELLQVTFPFGGHLRWTYVTDPYIDSRLLRAVSARYLAADSAGATEWAYSIAWDNASNETLHESMTLTDASGIGAKTWLFYPQTGLLNQLVQQASPSGAVLQRDTYTWSLSSSGNPYISSRTMVLNEGTTNAQSSLTQMSVDAYGNTTQTVQYPYNNSTSPLRTVNNTYLTTNPSQNLGGVDPSYLDFYIFNRVQSSSLTQNGTTITTASNSYDTTGQQGWLYGMAMWDSTTPVPLLMEGLLTNHVDPKHTVAEWYWVNGLPYQIAPSDALTTTYTNTSASNFGAPSTISTSLYSHTLTYNAWLGVTSATGSNGEQLTMTYDSAGRPSTGVSPYGATTSWAYSAANVLPATQEQTISDSLAYTRTTLDGLGRVIRVEKGTTSPQTAISWTDTVYAPCACSPLGKISKVSQPYTPGGTPVWTAYTYDGLGRTLTVQQPDAASTTTYSYSGNLTTVTDPAGNWKQFTSDVLGNLTLVTEPDPANQPGGTLSTNYTYDWMNNLTQVSMTRAGTTQTRTFVYNNAGLLTSATNPENGTVSYTYNANNTMATKTDAKGNVTAYTYDWAMRIYNEAVTSYSSSDYLPNINCPSKQFRWDTAANGIGRLASTTYWNCSPSLVGTGNMNLGFVTEGYAYTPAGLVTQKTVSVSGELEDDNGDDYPGPSASLAVNYTYNLEGNVSSINYPVALSSPAGSVSGPVTFSYGVDSMGRPNSLVDNSSLNTTWVQSAGYDVAGRMSSLQYLTQLNGPGSNAYVTQQLSYNVNGQLGQIAWSGGGAVTGSLTYGYPASTNNGQISQVVDAVSGETIAYQYDLLQRLTAASSTPTSGSSTAAWSESFQYDGFGNLTAKVLNGTTNSIPVNAATNRLTNAYYDAAGNMTSGAGATIAYDPMNRIAEVQETSGGAEYYSYDTSNRQTWRQLPNGATQFTFYGVYGEKLGVYGFTFTTGCGYYEQYGDQYFCGTTAVSFTPQSTNVMFAGRTIWSDGQAAFQDRVGTNRANGARFYPYGDEITSTSNDREKFATYTRDSYTGFDYAMSRYYVSTYGRFNTPDLYGPGAVARLPMSWNRYAYSLDDPIDHFDPNGACALVVCITRGVQVLGGFFQIGAGAALLAASPGAEVTTGGLASVVVAGAVVAGVGQIMSGVTNIIAGVTGSASATNAATVVATLTNPAGLVTASATGGNLNYSIVASITYDTVSSTVNFVSALTNGLPSTTSDLAAMQIVTAPFTNAISTVSTLATTYAPPDPSQLQISIYTAPVQVTGVVDYVPPMPSAVGQQLSITDPLCQCDLDGN